MKKLALLFLLLAPSLWAQQLVGANWDAPSALRTIPTGTHLLLGSANAYVDPSGNLTVAACTGCGSSGSGVTITNVAGLATVPSKANGTIAVVTDGVSATDCTTGGGSTKSNCQYNGSTWSALVAITGVSGLGTGVATALGDTPNATGGVVLYSGSLGTPTAGVITNLTGTCSGCGSNTVATAASTTNASYSIFAGSATSGQQGLSTVAGFTINPSTLALVAPGSISAGSSGSNPGVVILPGNTATLTPTANTVGWVGPNSASFTANWYQLPATGPSGTQALECGTASGNISACSWNTITGAVSSVSNSDSSLTISPTTGAVVASLNLAHGNTFTTGQTAPSWTFNSSGAGFMSLTAGAEGCVAGQPTGSFCQEAPSSIATAYHVIWPNAVGTSNQVLSISSVTGQAITLGWATTSSASWSAVTSGANAQTGAFSTTAPWTFSYAGTASTPGIVISGAPYTGGSTTTNFPQFYLNDGTGPSTFSANGTEFGINTPSGFTGNLEDYHINGGTSVWSINYQGNTIQAGTQVSGTSPTVNTPGTGYYIFGTDGTEPSSIGAGTSGFVSDSTSNCEVVWANASNVGCVAAASNTLTFSNKSLPINDVVSATGAITTIALGNNPLVITSALTSGTTNLTTSEATASSTAGAVLHQITALTTSTAIPLQITQGAAGPAATNAPALINISAAAAGGAASASINGPTGAFINLVTGAGAAGGATTGNGGTGGAFTAALGAGGAHGGTTTNTGGVGGAFLLTPGAGTAGAATGAGGAAGTLTVGAAVGGAGGATSGTGGAGSDFLVTTGTGGAATAGSTTGRGGNTTFTLGSAGGTGTAGAPGIFSIAGGSVAAANTSALLNLTETWNTTGVVDAAIFANVTNTASGSGSKLLDLQASTVSQIAVASQAANSFALGPNIILGGTAPEITTGGTTPYLNMNTLLNVADACKITSLIIMNSTTTICSWTLPAAAKTWAYQCQGTWESASVAVTLLLGTQFANAPTVSNHNAIIWSTNAGTQTSAGPITNTGTTAVTTLTSAAAAATATGYPWQASGSFTGSATSGTFIIYGTAGTSGDAQINAGSTCTLY